MSIIKIWKSRNQIVEGIKNNIFKKEDVEVIAQERLNICKNCDYIDLEGSKCFVPGTQPCCGECGCKLSFKIRSLSSSCPLTEPKWKAVLSIKETELLNEKLGL